MEKENTRPDVMVEQKEMGITKQEISALKHNFIQMAETLRMKCGAYSVKITIETDCDRERMCDMQVNIA